jgi:SAM-dependent methyltransferase
VTSAPPDQIETYWERAAKTRWGAYLSAQERHALLLAASLADPPELAVEVGCEGGRWSKLLHDAGWELVCTDVNPETLAICAGRILAARCLLVDPSDSTIPVDAGQAKLLIELEVAPVSQSEWFPSEAARVLRPGGMLVCTFYNPRSARGLAYRMLRALESRRRTGSRVRRFQDHFYSGPPYARSRAALRREGFEVVHEEGVSWFPFTRQSDSRLVPLFTRVERLLGLRRLPSLSPLVILVARRTDARQLR